MAKVAQNTGKLNVDGKIVKGTTAVTAAGTTEGQAVLGAPAPAEVAALGTATTNLTTARDAKAQADQDAKTATVELNAKEVAWDTAYADYCRMGQTKSGGDALKIGQIGLDVAAGKAPIGEMPQVLNLVATLGDLAGENDLVWDPVYGAVNYIIQYCEDPMVEANWKQFDTTSKSKITVTGLESGKLYWFRVCAKGTAPGQGPWSDPAQKRAA